MSDHIQLKQAFWAVRFTEWKSLNAGIKNWTKSFNCLRTANVLDARKEFRYCCYSWKKLFENIYGNGTPTSTVHALKYEIRNGNWLNIMNMFIPFESLLHLNRTFNDIAFSIECLTGSLSTNSDVRFWCCFDISMKLWKGNSENFYWLDTSQN